MKKKQFAELYTEEGEALAGGTPWESYPRPHLKRDSYLCLNGRWEFSVTKGGAVPAYSEEINVPFVPQSILSGIHRNVEKGDVLCYRRRFSLPSGFEKKRTRLHIGAADQKARVCLNGSLLGEHVGGYDGFSFDLCDLNEGENIIEIFVTDDGGTTLPYGKQREKRGGMWYTPVSGIWQTVWIESLPDVYVSDIKIKSRLDSADITFEMNDGSRPDGELILDDGQRFEINHGMATVTPKDPKHWTPDSPHLYFFTARIGEDSIGSYFALRTLSIREVNGRPLICLNEKPIFFHGLLDQGYFSDGIFLPASPEGYERDVLAAKRFGFNMLRKHIKIEPELFYYACDRLGMIVFQDMVNNGDYSFLKDTALPTVGFRRRNDKRMHRDPTTRLEFLRGMEKTVSKLDFHPSVCYWTIFNEGWGQFDHASAYRLLRSLDPTRPIDSVSGWFSGKETVSDVESLHVYFKEVKLTPSDRPIVLSEFGGYSYKVEDHSFNPHDNYGYGSFRSAEELESAITKLYTEQVLPSISRGLCGAVYTQLTDVEDETNGLLTYDRRVTKISENGATKISEALFSEFKKLYC